MGYDMVEAYAPYKAAFEKRMETIASWQYEIIVV
jgi:hypothetical protein